MYPYRKPKDEGRLCAIYLTMSAATKAIRQFANNPLVMSLYVPSFLWSFGVTMLIPVLPIYAREFTQSYGLIGFMLAMDGFGRLAGDLPAGMVLRHYDRKYVMMAGITVSALAMGLMFTAQTMEQAIGLYFIVGFGMSFFNIARHAYIVDAVSLTSRGRSIALFGGVHRMARAFGPGFGGFVARALGLRVPFLALVVLCVGILAVLALYVPPTQSRNDKHTSGGFSHLIKTVRANWRVLLTAGTGQILVQTVRTGAAVIVPLYGADVLGLGVDSIGLIVSLAAAVEMTLFYPAGYVMDRFGRKYAIVPTFVLQAIGLALMVTTAGFAGLLATTTLIGIGNGLSSGTMMTLGADLAPPETRGEFLGVWRLIGDVGFVGGPGAVGIVSDMFALATAPLVLSGVGFAAAGMFIFFIPETLKQDHQ